jgi:hypothetical protein
MRTRSTWKNDGPETPRQAASNRRADLYTMNQNHPQPSATDYQNGDPDAWAETPTSNQSVEQEYDGEHVKRNEIGLGEFRDDTYKHKDSEKWNDGKKYDNAKMASERKALAATRVAAAILRTSNEKLVEETAIDLMALPPKALVATLKRMEMASVNSLPAESKYRRAVACTKLAARLLGEAATETFTEKLATCFMQVDDPTLKSILKTVAAAHEESKGTEKEEEKAEKVSMEADKAEAPKEEKTEKVSMKDCAEEEHEAHGLTPEEMGMLDQMLCSEMAPATPVLTPAVPAVTPVDAELMAIFTPVAAEGAPAPAAAPEAAPAPAVPAADAEISFDDDEEEGVSQMNTASVADLFSDDPEVQAQRQIRQAHHEQVQRVAGYAGVGRTASAGGAKKLGKVQPEKASPAQALEALWDRP